MTTKDLESFNSTSSTFSSGNRSTIIKGIKFVDYIKQICELNKSLSTQTILNTLYTRYESQLKISLLSLISRIIKFGENPESTPYTLQLFKSLPSTSKLEELLCLFEKDLSAYTSQIIPLHMDLLKTSLNSYNTIINQYSRSSQIEMAEFWKTYIFQEVLQVNDFAEPSKDNIKQEHATVTKERRGQIKKSYISPTVEETGIIKNIEFMPILFDQMYIKSPKSTELRKMSCEKSSTYAKYHLIVLVHGFMGTEYDMKQIKNTLYRAYPKNIYLISKRNEGSTQGNVSSMGLALAREVKDFIRNEVGDFDIAKISFIGHSLGGLMIRSALQYLSEFKDKMYLLMTISSPHLGVDRGSNFLVKTGIYLYRYVVLEKSIRLYFIIPNFTI